MNNKYELGLKNMCRYCGTSPANCNKKKCTRYNAMKEAVDKALAFDEIMDNYLEIAYDKKDRPYLRVRKENKKPIDIQQIIAGTKQ